MLVVLTNKEEEEMLLKMLEDVSPDFNIESQYEGHPFGYQRSAQSLKDLPNYPDIGKVFEDYPDAKLIVYKGDKPLQLYSEESEVRDPSKQTGWLNALIIRREDYKQGLAFMETLQTFCGVPEELAH